MYCGPYALARNYQYFGNPIDSILIARQLRATEVIGVYADSLIEHALARGYSVSRYVSRRGRVQQEAADWYLKRGATSHFGVRYSQKFLKELSALGPFIVNIDGREYIKCIGSKRARRQRKPFPHFLFVRRYCDDGTFECDDAYATAETVFIPVDMMIRMLNAHKKSSILRIEK